METEKGEMNSWTTCEIGLRETRQSVLMARMGILRTQILLLRAGFCDGDGKENGSGKRCILFLRNLERSLMVMEKTES